MLTVSFPPSVLVLPTVRAPPAFKCEEPEISPEAALMLPAVMVAPPAVTVKPPESTVNAPATSRVLCKSTAPVTSAPPVLIVSFPPNVPAPPAWKAPAPERRFVDALNVRSVSLLSTAPDVPVAKIRL